MRPGGQRISARVTNATLESSSLAGVDPICRDGPAAFWVEAGRIARRGVSTDTNKDAVVLPERHDPKRRFKISLGGSGRRTRAARSHRAARHPPARVAEELTDSQTTRSVGCPDAPRSATVVAMAPTQVALPLDAALAHIISMLEQHRARMSGLLERLDRLRDDVGDGATAVVFGRMCKVLHERDEALAALAAGLGGRDQRERSTVEVA